MLKILHTADWHIGAELNGYSLEADFKAFRDWLVFTCIPAHNTNVLLVSGDIFDKANPSAASRKIYFETLHLLHKSGIQKIIITGGNHDSPMTLDAPAELLKYLDIHVVGGVPTNPEDLLIPLGNSQETPEVLIAAVPFLRDSDIRTSLPGQNTEAREDAVRTGITNFYARIAELCQPWKNKGSAIIACGHLFATGALTSDSERAVQVGNLGSVDASVFPELAFNYVALGHIHRPQKVGGQDRIRYSGSPIALSFSERTQQKMILGLTIDSGQIQVEEILIPLFRQLIRITGTFEYIKSEIQNIVIQEALFALVEIRVEETQMIPGLIRDLTDWVESFSAQRQDLRIAQYKYVLTSAENTNSKYANDARSLHELKPMEVFDSLLNEQNVEMGKRAVLQKTFLELLESLQQNKV